MLFSLGLILTVLSLLQLYSVHFDLSLLTMYLYYVIMHTYIIWCIFKILTELLWFTIQKGPIWFSIRFMIWQPWIWELFHLLWSPFVNPLLLCYNSCKRRNVFRVCLFVCDCQNVNSLLQVKIAIIGITAGNVGLDFSSAQHVVFLELPQTPSHMSQVYIKYIIFSIAESYLIIRKWSRVHHF